MEVKVILICWVIVVSFWIGFNEYHEWWKMEYDEWKEMWKMMREMKRKKKKMDNDDDE